MSVELLKNVSLWDATRHLDRLYDKYQHRSAYVKVKSGEQNSNSAITIAIRQNLMNGFRPGLLLMKK